MTQTTAARKLVKSGPELWAVCSDAQSLGRHLGAAFGEIRITRLEPEVTVAWEGERASGTVTLEPSGWGTKVTLTATAADAFAAEEPAATEESAATQELVAAEAPEPVIEESVAEEAVAIVEAPMIETPTIVSKPSLFTRIATWFKGGQQEVVAAAMEPTEVAEPAPRPAEPQPQPQVTEPELTEPEPQVAEPEPPPEPQSAADPVAVLDAALDSLGQAHRRPFSEH